MKEKEKEVKIPLNEIPVDGALGLLALGDIGVKLWREARLKKAQELKSAKEQQDEQKKG